jgi:hypothetical protein
VLHQQPLQLADGDASRPEETRDGALGPSDADSPVVRNGQRGEHPLGSLMPAEFAEEGPLLALPASAVDPELGLVQLVGELCCGNQRRPIQVQRVQRPQGPRHADG